MWTFDINFLPLHFSFNEKICRAAVLLTPPKPRLAQRLFLVRIEDEHHDINPPSLRWGGGAKILEKFFLGGIWKIFKNKGVLNFRGGAKFLGGS